MISPRTRMEPWQARKAKKWHRRPDRTQPRATTTTESEVVLAKELIEQKELSRPAHAPTDRCRTLVVSLALVFLACRFHFPQYFVTRTGAA
jgi:hypothetical protein